MINVYEQVSRNKLRSSLIIGLFSSFIILVAYFITKAYDLDGTFLIFAIFFSAISSLGSYFYGDKMVLMMNQAKPANKNNYPLLYQVIENLSIVNQTPMPQIYIIDTYAQNAFATGRDPKHAIICVTTGLISKLNRSELEAVIAHELSHIKNYDIRLMTIVSILIGSLSILINMAYRSSFFRKSDKENNQANTIIALLGFILIIFAPLIAQLIQLAISRRREYYADASAVKLTRQPQSLINALTKISNDDSVFETASTATASLYITNPFKDNKIASLFSTHPPIKDRIKALQSML